MESSAGSGRKNAFKKTEGTDLLIARNPEKHGSASKKGNSDADSPPPRHHGGSFRTYFDNKKQNLAEQRQALRKEAEGDLPDQIFENLVVYINGYPGDTPKHVLIELLVQRGARIQDWPNKSTTHEIATSLNWRKAEKRLAPGARFQRHVVTSAWVTESVNANRRLLERRFRPAMLQNTTGIRVFQEFEQSQSKFAEAGGCAATKTRDDPELTSGGMNNNGIETGATNSASTKRRAPGTEKMGLVHPKSVDEKHHGGSRRTYFKNKEANLQEQRQALRDQVNGEPLPEQIFGNVVAYINGDTGDTPVHELQALLVRRGAQLQDWPNRHTTHEIALSLNWRKAEKRRAPGTRFHRHVVTSQWVVQSARAGRRLLERHFVPNLLRDKSGVKAFDGFQQRPAESHCSANATSAMESTNSISDAQPNGSSMPLSNRTNCNHPDFVKGFFEQSRLHLIGSWRDIWRRAVQKHRADESRVNGAQGAKAVQSRPQTLYSKLMGGGAGGNKHLHPKDMYVHVDMDCFFASVALLAFPADNPIHQKPVVVAHTGNRNGETPQALASSSSSSTSTSKASSSSLGGGRQEVSSANYIARKYGIKAGHSVASAQKKIAKYQDEHPEHHDAIELVVLPYPFEKINEVAEEVYRIYLECSPPEHSIQVKSIDEAYFRIPFEGPDHRRRNGSRRSLAVGSGAGFASRHSRISSSADLILNDDHGGDADGTQLSGNSEHWNSGNEAADLDSGSDDDSPTAQATRFAKKLRTLIRQRTGCTASAGVGPNKFLARCATNVAKPDGFHVCASREDARLRLIPQMSVRSLPGIGWKKGRILRELEPPLETAQDLINAGRDRLVTLLGAGPADMVWALIHGDDPRPPHCPTPDNPFAEKKSISVDINWGLRFKTPAQVDAFLRRLCAEAVARLCSNDLKCNHLTLQIKRRKKTAPVEPSKFLGHGSCDNFTKSKDLRRAVGAGPGGDASNVDESERLFQHVRELLQPLQVPPDQLRGVGLQMTKLSVVQRRTIVPVTLKPRNKIRRSESRDQSRIAETLHRDEQSSHPSMAAVTAENTPTLRRTSSSAVSVNSAASSESAASSQSVVVLGSSSPTVGQSHHSVTADRGQSAKRQLNFVDLDSQSQQTSPVTGRSDGDEDVEPQLTWTQVDPSVLNALPEDIRRQQVAALDRLRERRVRRGEKNRPWWHEMAVGIDMSAINLDVFNELPRDVQAQQLRLLRIKQQADRKINARAWSRAVAVKPSMAELIGRASSSHSKTVAFENGETQEISQNRTEHTSAFIAPKVVTIAEAAAGRQDRLAHAKYRAVGGRFVARQAFSKFRAPLRSWLARVSRPQEEHMWLLTGVAKQFVVDGNLEDVAKLLGVLRAWVDCGCTGEAWATAINLVEESVQLTVTEHYGQPVDFSAFIPGP